MLDLLAAIGTLYALYAVLAMAIGLAVFIAPLAIWNRAAKGCNQLATIEDRLVEIQTEQADRDDSLYVQLELLVALLSGTRPEEDKSTSTTRCPNCAAPIEVLDGVRALDDYACPECGLNLSGRIVIPQPQKEI